MSEWNEWKGGACPVDADSLVDVRFRTGEDDHGAEARQWSWSLSHDGDDIIAYRLHHSEQKVAQLNGWIKCSVLLPTAGTPLLVCTPCGVVQRTVYHFDPSDNTWQDWYESNNAVPLESFGHWQTLPAPPDE